MKHLTLLAVCLLPATALAQGEPQAQPGEYEQQQGQQLQGQQQPGQQMQGQQQPGQQMQGQQLQGQQQPGQQLQGQQALQQTPPLGQWIVADSVTAGEIAKNPEKYYGKYVTVRAEVEDVMNLHLFTLDEDRIFAGPDVLVLIPNPVAQVPENWNVRVTGKVQPYVKGQFEAQYPWLAEADLDLQDRPILIAESVRTDLGTEYVQGRSIDGLLRVSAGEIARNPNQFYGHFVAVKGKVEDRYGRNVFTLEEDRLFSGPDVLVVVPNLLGSIEAGNNVTVVGEVQRMTRADFEQKYPDIKLDQAFDLDKRGILVAESVITESGRELAATTRPSDDGGAWIAIIALTPDKSSLVGDAYRLANVRVSEVISDRVFLISNQQGQTVPVVLADTAAPGADIQQGQYLDLSGIVQEVPQSGQGIGLDQPAFQRMQQHQLYFHATRVNVRGEI